jgi:DoxX-like protein
MKNLVSSADAADSAARSRGRTIAYWGSTILLGLEGVVGGVLALIRYPPYARVLLHLGYPLYFMTIIGICYTLAGVALLAPRFPRLKEWAYAGLVINYIGAAASHGAAGDPAVALVAPAVFTILTIASWALRPPARRLDGPRL